MSAWPAAIWRRREVARHSPPPLAVTRWASILREPLVGGGPLAARRTGEAAR